jgi:SPX domain protein involved in polyphosphate accumulation
LKILKKHDKHLPNNPCKAFYVSRMHAQAWVRGDYSDLVVRLSHVYVRVRKDQVTEQSNDASQSFVRSTTKYWIKTEDVSRVKYTILRHLPVSLRKTSTGESDSQFTNSVYLDNDQLELYHGRLDKAPGAMALRLRWYEVADPKFVFVERKTHNDKWTGEVSVKERFTVSPYSMSF